MRKCTLFFLPFMVLLMSFSYTNWEVFKSFKGKFKILTPGVMVEKVNTIETEIGDLNYITFLHQSKEKDSDNLVYMVSYCDYPENSIHSDSTELVQEFFQTTIATAVESVKGELRYSSEIEMGDYPGMLWRVDYNEGRALIKTKSFLVGRRYYSVQAITLKEKSLNTTIDKFLDSFGLLKEFGDKEEQ